MDIISVLYYALGLLAGLLALVYTTVVIFSHTPRDPVESERSFRTTTVKGDIDPEVKPLPQRGIVDPIEGIELSVVVPCYNETSRLRLLIEEAVVYLKETYVDCWEVVIVDDGSKDGTAEYALKLAAEFDFKPGQMRVVQLAKNRGKGGAVTHGMQHVRGRYAVFADADGASKFSDVSKLVAAIETSGDSPAVAIGSRAHMVTTDAVVKRTFIRNFLMYSLHTLVFVFGIRDIKDTQCGFKLFNRRAINEIFPYMHTERWIFDVEILIIAIRKHIPIHEIAISWHEVDGSKVDLARDSINMAIDLVVTRLAYILGIYKDN